MGYKPYDPLGDRNRTWRSRLMVPGAIGALFLVVAIGTTLTVIGIMRLLDSPDTAELSSAAAQNAGTAAASEQRQPLVPLPTVAPTAIPTPVPTVAPTAVPTVVPTVAPTPPPLPSPATVAEAQDANPIKTVYNRIVASVVRISTASESVGIGQPFGEAGSGFVIDEDGHVLTNFHVVKDAKDLQVTLNDGTWRVARIVGTDPGSDVALLKADIRPSDDVVIAPLGSSASVEVGDQVIAIGSPFYSYINSLSEGRVTGLGRQYAFSGRTITGMIQTGASINTGSSGGPLLDLDGKVVGINTAIQSRNFVGIALALPIDRVKAILPDLRAGRTPKHAWLPIYGSTITPQMGEQCNLPVDYGVIVYSILPGAKLNHPFTTGANGDIIVSIDDVPVRELNDLSRYIDAYKKPGDIVELRVYRERKVNQLLEITLEEWPNKTVSPLTQTVDCSSPTSEPINAPTVLPITAEMSTNAPKGKFIISEAPLTPAIVAATSPMTAPPANPATMPRAAIRSDDPMAAVSVAVAWLTSGFSASTVSPNDP